MDPGRLPRTAKDCGPGRLPSSGQATIIPIAFHPSSPSLHSAVLFAHRGHAAGRRLGHRPGASGPGEGTKPGEAEGGARDGGAVPHLVGLCRDLRYAPEEEVLSTMALVRLPDFAAQTGERLASRSVVDLGTFVSSRSEPLASVVHIFCFVSHTSWGIDLPLPYILFVGLQSAKIAAAFL